jgi:hypothetical protein
MGEIPNDHNPRLKENGKRTVTRRTPKHEAERAAQLWQDTQMRANESVVNIIEPIIRSTKKSELPLDQGDRQD